MPKPSKDNEYIRKAMKVWEVQGHTFCMISQSKQYYDCYLVRVFHHDDTESHWLDFGPWETESGAAWGILNWMDIKNS